MSTEKSASAVGVVFVACLAHVLTMLISYAFPAMLPTFFDIWQISNTEAGWIAGIFYAGYSLGVPVLVSLTDRYDGRYIYVLGTGLIAAGALGFGLVASGFWSALFFQAVCGLGLAGTYMPGLKILIDRYEGGHQPRIVAFYTASFSLGVGTSFFTAGQLEPLIGWQQAFIVAGAGALLAGALIYFLMRPHTPAGHANETHFLDFRPVFQNRSVVGYIFGYSVHCWELMASRSWIVAFLVFAVAQTSSEGSVLSPTTVATVTAMAAMVSSIVGSELARAYGRLKVIAIVMVLTAAVAFIIGFSGTLPFMVVALLAILYATLVQADSAVLTAGVVAVAKAEMRGATLAMYSVIGFFCAFLGPLIFGVILDLTGGKGETLAWGLAFASLGVVGLTGPVAMRYFCGQDKN